MGYKNIMISNSVKLSVKNQQLQIGGKEDVTIPLEDINCILIENMTVSFSSYLLQVCSEYGITVYFCDEKHLPNAVLLPLVRHSRHYKMLKAQMDINKPFQKRLWQQLVIQKIENQSRCLQFLKRDGWKQLDSMQRQVLSGDKTNVEARAAALYFRELVGVKFYREEDSIINAALNYGYAILRGLIARTLICYGFEPSIGLFHHSELNSYNLADDFIEPFRPVVDLYVMNHFQDIEKESDLTPERKKGLFRLLSFDMMIQGEKHSVSNSVDKAVMSFNSCLMGLKEELLLPVLILEQVHQYE